MFTCGSEDQIESSRVCDGIMDCLDDSDEFQDDCLKGKLRLLNDADTKREQIILHRKYIGYPLKVSIIVLTFLPGVKWTKSWLSFIASTEANLFSNLYLACTASSVA